MATNTLKNFAVGQLLNSINANNGTLVLQAGQGDRFPNPGVGTDTNFYVSCWDSTTYATPDKDQNRAIFLITARSGDTLTYTDAQQGTLASSHPAGATILEGLTQADWALAISGCGDYAVDTGSVNAMSATVTNYPTVLSDGMCCTVKAAVTNTSPTVTLNFAGTGLNAVVRFDGNPLQVGDIVANSIYFFVSIGGQWTLMNPKIVLNYPIANVVLIGKSLGSGSSITSITVSAGVATVTQTAHGYATGDWVNPSGATGAGVGDINQLHQITVTGANTYTFVTTATGVIGGTIVNMFWLKGTRTISASLIKVLKRANPGNIEVDFLNTQSDAYYGVPLPTGAAASHSLTSNIGPGYGLSQVPTTTTIIFTFLDQSTSVDPTSYFCIELQGIQ